VKERVREEREGRGGEGRGGEGRGGEGGTHTFSAPGCTAASWSSHPPPPRHSTPHAGHKWNFVFPSIFFCPSTITRGQQLPPEACACNTRLPFSPEKVCVHPLRKDQGHGVEVVVTVRAEAETVVSALLKVMRD
jgi:hypothetical protein